MNKTSKKFLLNRKRIFWVFNFLILFSLIFVRTFLDAMVKVALQNQKKEFNNDKKKFSSF
jgi:hypothetical protein